MCREKTFQKSRCWSLLLHLTLMYYMVLYLCGNSCEKPKNWIIQMSATYPVAQGEFYFYFTHINVVVFILLCNYYPSDQAVISKTVMTAKLTAQNICLCYWQEVNLVPKETIIFSIFKTTGPIWFLGLLITVDKIYLLSTKCEKLMS